MSSVLSRVCPWLLVFTQPGRPWINKTDQRRSMHFRSSWNTPIFPVFSVACERQVGVMGWPGHCALRDCNARWRCLHLKRLCDFHVCKGVLQATWFLMLSKMTPHKSTKDVKFLYVLCINWAMFSVFMYHALTYHYVNNEHERSIFCFSVYLSHYFTEFHSHFRLED